MRLSKVSLAGLR
jgi:hypothetical protein